MDNDFPNTPNAVLALMPTTDVQIASFARQIINSVRDGKESALKIQVLMRALEAVSELVRDEIEDNVMAEADRYGEKTIELYGALIKKEEVNTRYNYLKTGDVEYEQLHADLEIAKGRVKVREEFLRNLKEPMRLLDERTGELYQVHPPFKTSKAGIKVYLKHGK